MLGVVLAVDVALEQLGVADDAEHLVLLDELGRRRGQHRGIGRDVLVRVLDRVAVDAAVGVDAVEVDGRHLRDPREVDAGDVGGRATELDRIAGRGLTGVHAARAGLDDHLPAGRLRRRRGPGGLFRALGGGGRAGRLGALRGGGRRCRCLGGLGGGGRRPVPLSLPRSRCRWRHRHRRRRRRRARWMRQRAPHQTCRSFILPSPLSWTSRPRYRAIHVQVGRVPPGPNVQVLPGEVQGPARPPGLTNCRQRCRSPAANGARILTW